MTDTSIPLYGHFTKGGSPLVKESTLTKSRLPLADTLHSSSFTSTGGKNFSSFPSLPLLPILPYSTISSEYQLDISLDDELVSIASSNSSQNFGISMVNNDDDEEHGTPNLHRPQPSSSLAPSLLPSNDTPPVTTSTVMTNSINTTTFLPSYDDIHNHTSANLSAIQVIQDDHHLGTSATMLTTLEPNYTAGEHEDHHRSSASTEGTMYANTGETTASSSSTSSSATSLRASGNGNHPYSIPESRSPPTMNQTEQNEEENEEDDVISMEVINHHTGSLLSTILPVTPGLDPVRLQNILSTLAIEYRKQELLNIHHTSELQTIHQQCNALENRLQSSDHELRKTKETNGYFRHIFEHLLRILRNENLPSTKNLTLASLMEAAKTLPPETMPSTNTDTVSPNGSPRSMNVIDTVSTVTASSYLSQAMLSLPPLHLLRGEVLDVAGQRLDILEKELLQKQQIINEQALTLRKLRAYQGSSLASQRQEIQRLHTAINRTTTLYEARLAETTQTVLEHQQQISSLQQSQQHYEQQYRDLKTRYDTMEIDLNHYMNLSTQTQTKLQTAHQHLQWAEEAIGVLKDEVHARDTLLNNQAGIIANLEKEIENIRKGNAMVSLQGEISAEITMNHGRMEDTVPATVPPVTGNDENKEIQQLRYLLTSARAETAKAQADAASLRASLIKLNHRTNIIVSVTEAGVQTETVAEPRAVEILPSSLRSSLVEDQAMEIAVLRAQLELARAQNSNAQPELSTGITVTKTVVNDTVHPVGTTDNEPLSIRKPSPIVTSSPDVQFTMDNVGNEMVTPSIVNRIPLHEPTRPARTIHPTNNNSTVSSSISDDPFPSSPSENELLSPLSRQLVHQTVPEVPRNHGSLSLADSLNASYEVPPSASSVLPTTKTYEINDGDQDIQLEILQELTNHSNGLKESKNSKDTAGNDGFAGDDRSGTDDDEEEDDDYNNSDWDVEWDSEGELQKNRTHYPSAQKKPHSSVRGKNNKISTNIHISVDTGGLLALPSPTYGANRSGTNKRSIPLHVARASPLTPHPFTETNSVNNPVTETKEDKGLQSPHETVIPEPCTDKSVCRESMTMKNDNDIEEDSWTFLQPAGQ